MLKTKRHSEESIAENTGITEAKLFIQQNVYPLTRREN